MIHFGFWFSTNDQQAFTDEIAEWEARLEYFGEQLASYIHSISDPAIAPSERPALPVSRKYHDFGIRHSSGVYILVGECRSGNHDMEHEYWRMYPALLRALNFLSVVAGCVSSKDEVHVYLVKRSVREITHQRSKFDINRDDPLAYAKVMLSVVNEVMVCRNKVYDEFDEKFFPTEDPDTFYEATRNDPTKGDTKPGGDVMLDCLFVWDQPRFARTIYTKEFYDMVYEPGLAALRKAHPETQERTPQEGVQRTPRALKLGEHDPMYSKRLERGIMVNEKLTRQKPKGRGKQTQERTPQEGVQRTPRALKPGEPKGRGKQS